MARIHIIDIEDPNDEDKSNPPACRDVDLRLEYELRHLFRLMGTFGLFHHSKNTSGLSSDYWQACLGRLQTIYCIIVQMILWLNVIRSIVGVVWTDEDTPSFSILAFIYFVWVTNGAINCSIWYWICSSRNLDNILAYWQNFCQSSEASFQLDTRLELGWVRKRFVVAIVCSVFIL